MTRTLFLMVVVVANSSLGYEFADCYSDQTQRKEWELSLAAMSETPPWFVWHPAGHLAGFAGKIRFTSTAAIRDWLQNHRELFGIRSQTTFTIKGDASPFWALDRSYQKSKSPSGTTVEFIPSFAEREYFAPIRGITQIYPDGSVMLVGLVNSAAPELLSPNTNLSFPSPASAFAKAGSALGTTFVVHEFSRLVLADGHWLETRAVSRVGLHWWLVGVDSTGTRRSLLLSADTGSVTVEYEGLVSKFAPRHEKHIPINPIAPFSSPASFDWNVLAGAAPVSCSAATATGACSEPAFSEVQLSKNVVPAAVDYWYDRSLECNRSIDWPFSPIYPPAPQYINRCNVRPVSGGSSVQTLKVIIAESGATCTGPCWYRDALLLPIGDVSPTLVGHEWGHETLKSLGQFNHTSDGFAPNNAVTEFLADGIGIIHANHQQAGPWIAPDWDIYDAAGVRQGGFSSGFGSCSSWSTIRTTLGGSTRSAFDIHMARKFFGGPDNVTRSDASFRAMERGFLSALSIIQPLPYLTDWVAAVVATRAACDGRLVALSATTCFNELGDALVGGLVAGGAATQTIAAGGYRVSPCAP